MRFGAQYNVTVESCPWLYAEPGCVLAEYAASCAVQSSARRKRAAAKHQGSPTPIVRVSPEGGQPPLRQNPSMFALYLLGMISLAEISLACASGSTFLAARCRARMIDATMATVSTTAITPSESAVGM